MRAQESDSARVSRPSKYRLLHILVVVLVAAYLFPQIDRGWIPHDEGTLGHAAERVLNGGLPHVDFDDPYTGGQAMLHAAAFKLLGTSSHSTRLILFAFSLVFTSATYLLASRIAPPVAAALITLLAVVWSVPNYFAALPSWYNLFFAVCGTWTLVKYDETNRTAWLVATGTIAALSLLFKVTGLYLVAACLLFLVYREQDRPRTVECGERLDMPGGRVFSLFITLALAAFVTALVVLIRHRLTLMDVLHFVLPGMAVSAYLILNEWRAGPSRSSARFAALLGPVAWVSVGFLLPVALFLIPYVLTENLASLVHGVFVLPQKRLAWGTYPLPPVTTLLAIVPWLVLLMLPLAPTRYLGTPWLTAAAGVASVAGIMYGANELVYQAVWGTTRPLVPIAVLAGLAVLLWGDPNESRSGQRRLLFLLLATTAMVSLVQFPYGFGIYFCYVAPLLVLALASLIHSQGQLPKMLHLVVLLFYLGFSIAWLNKGDVRHIGVRYRPNDHSTWIANPRSGLRVSEYQAHLYEQVVAEIRRHSADGDYIYAATDSPEIYFLADRKNPTATFYDFFEADYTSDADARARRILRTVEEHSVNVVIFHWGGEFSGPPQRTLVAALAQRYPNVKHFQRGPGESVMSVAWR